MAGEARSVSWAGGAEGGGNTAAAGSFCLVCAFLKAGVELAGADLLLLRVEGIKKEEVG